MKKQLAAVSLILSISLLSAFSVYPSLEDYHHFAYQAQSGKNETPTESWENSPGKQDDVEKKYIEIPEQIIKMGYFDSFGDNINELCTFKIKINSTVESEFTLFMNEIEDDNSKDEPKTEEGNVIKGENYISVPYRRKDFLTKKRHVYRLNFKHDNTDHNVEIKFNLDYDGWPKDKCDFNPETGEIDLKVRPEGKKVLIHKSNLALNKKTFIKSGLTNLILGGIILLAGPQIDQASQSVNSRWARTSVESSRRLATTFGIGLTVCGLNGIFKSLKINKLNGEVLESDEESVRYNKNLKDEYEKKIREWKERITVKISVKLVQNKINGEVR